MADATPAIIAVAGTLSGSTLTYIFQRMNSQREEASKLQTELRVERRIVYSSYSAALTEFRRGQLDWYNRRKEDPHSDRTKTASDESYWLQAWRKVCSGESGFLRATRH